MGCGDVVADALSCKPHDTHRWDVMCPIVLLVFGLFFFLFQVQLTDQAGPLKETLP